MIYKLLDFKDVLSFRIVSKYLLRADTSTLIGVRGEHRPSYNIRCLFRCYLLVNDEHAKGVIINHKVGKIQCHGTMKDRVVRLYTDKTWYDLYFTGNNKVKGDVMGKYRVNKREYTTKLLG